MVYVHGGALDCHGDFETVIVAATFSNVQYETGVIVHVISVSTDARSYV